MAVLVQTRWGDHTVSPGSNRPHRRAGCSVSAGLGRTPRSPSGERSAEGRGVRSRSVTALETPPATTDQKHTSVHRYTCPLCECMCGLDITVAESTTEAGPTEQRVTLVRGARDDVWSKGYICPKGSA